MSVSNPRTLGWCNCEHLSHFPNEWPADPRRAEVKLRRSHKYLAMKVLTHQAQYVGAICTECAYYCLSDYLIEGKES